MPLAVACYWLKGLTRTHIDVLLIRILRHGSLILSPEALVLGPSYLDSDWLKASIRAIADVCVLLSV